MIPFANAKATTVLASVVPGPAPPTAAQAWSGVAILLVFSLFSILDRNILALMIDPIKADLKLSDTHLGLLQGFAFVTFYAVAGLPIGWAVDRYPRRVILYLGITLWSLSAAFCGLSRNFWQLFLGRTFVGVGEATMSPSAMSLIGDLFPPGQAAAPFGLYSAGFYLGSGIALGLGGLIIGFFLGRPPTHLWWLGEIRPWQMVFIVAGVPGLAVALLAFLIHDPGRPRARTLAEGESAASLVGQLRARGRVTFHTFAGFTAAAMIAYVIPAWTPTFFARHFGMAVRDIGWTFGLVVAVSGGVGAFLGGLLLGRIIRSGRTDAHFLLPGLGALACAPMLVGAYWMPGPLAALGSLALGMAIFGASGAAVYPTFQRIAPSELRGRLTAAYVLCGALVGGGLGPVLVALLTDRMFRDDRQVGASVAIVVAGALALMSLSFLSGRKSLQALPA